jgi:hypothetical protein
LTAKTVKDRWERSLRSNRAEREQAAVNDMFLRNKHWVFWNRSTSRLEEMPRDPSRVRATVAKIGPDSRRVISKLLRRPLVFDVRPTSADDAAARASRIAESALSEVHDKQRWEDLRHDHANVTWAHGVGALKVDWDWRVGTPIGFDEQGRLHGTGDVNLDVVSIQEIACEPGTRDLERALWWIHGVAMPPAEVKRMFTLDKEPKADARAVDTVWRIVDGETLTNVPLTMVLTYYQRPVGTEPGVVMTVVDNQIVDQGEWPFPFDDKLNIAIARIEPIHGRWYGHTPVSDAVPVQALLNASWSSIVEHLKLAGNARCWVPQGSVEDVEDLTDTPGEYVEYNPINGQSPKWEAPPVMPDWWVRQPEMLGSAMDDILGQHDVSRGQAPSGVESGIALSILSENDDTPIGALARSLGDAWGRAATMVLEIYERNVEETRAATIYNPGGVPESIKWAGKDLMGQTTATVPTDAVIPRSRAAQAAYAMQLFDRGILKTPGELAKVADLPDQDDLMAGIDPDSARAQRENYWLAIGTPRTVDIIDDHNNHLLLHRNFMRSERYEYLPQEVQQLVKDHAQAHEMYAAGMAAQQVQAMGVSPLAAMLPTEGTKVLPADDLAGAQAMGGMVPQSAMSPAAPASPGQAMGMPGGLPPEIESEINTLGGSPEGINPPAETVPGGEPPPAPPPGMDMEGMP